MSRRDKALKSNCMKDQTGSAAVEFAIVIPIFLFCVMAFLQSGFFIYTHSTLLRLAEDGQRHLLFEPNDAPGARKAILAAMADTGLDPKKLTISIRHLTTPFNHVELALNYPFQFAGPFPLPQEIPLGASVIVPEEK